MRKKSKGHYGTAKIINDNLANRAANVESTAGDESLGPQAGQRFDSPVSILVISYRVRLADPDGISAKAAIDGLVYFGILRDDSQKEVEEVRFRQVKVKNFSEEKTIIEIKVVE